MNRTVSIAVLLVVTACAPSKIEPRFVIERMSFVAPNLGHSVEIVATVRNDGRAPGEVVFDCDAKDNSGKPVEDGAGDASSGHGGDLPPGGRAELSWESSSADERTVRCYLLNMTMGHRVDARAVPH